MERQAVRIPITVAPTHNHDQSSVVLSVDPIPGMPCGREAKLIIESYIHAAVGATNGLDMLSYFLQGKDSFMLTEAVDGQIPDNADTIAAPLITVSIFSLRVIKQFTNRCLPPHRKVSILWSLNWTR